MATKPIALTIELTENLHKYVEASAESVRAESAEEYVKQLIREDWLKKRTALEADLIAAMKDEPLDITEEELASDESLIDILDRKILAAEKSSVKSSAA